jgi:Tol biopolymer transport system component
MDEAPPDIPSDPARTAWRDRLDSWKEIAAYLGRGVTTVQRWEQEEDLPVHRLPHAKKGSVFAFRRELDTWRIARAQSIEQSKAHASSVKVDDKEISSAPEPLSFRRPLALAILALVVFGLAALGLTTAFSRPTSTVSSVSAAPPLQPRPLANDGAAELQPSLSPDGSRVVYRWGRADRDGLYIKPVASGAASRLLADGSDKFARAGYSKWSPRGDLISFLVQEDPATPNVRGLYVVSPNGGTPRRLTSISGIGVCWAPDGRSLGFADRNSTGEPFSIFSVSLDGVQRQRLTVPPAGSFGDTQCAFSREGDRLAVARFATHYQADVYVVGVEHGSHEPAIRLTYDFGGINELTWTPDGRSILFGSQSGLWNVESSTRNSDPKLTLVTGTGNRINSPSFSQPARGQPARLAYEYTTWDVNLWRWRREGEGNGTITRVPGSTQWEDHPAVSPDGRRIAFASNRTGATEIWVSNADGSDPRQLTFHRGPVAISPQWSPDGQRLAFSSQAGGNRDIYVIDADGSRSVRLTWEPSNDEKPSWSRDGKWIYFRSDRGEIGQIWKISSAGGSAPVRVTAGVASHGSESPDGKLFYFVRSLHEPGLWSVAVDGGKEVLVLPDVQESAWGVADQGIAYFTSRPQQSPDGPTIRFFDFATHHISTLAKLPASPRASPMGFTVDWDARTILWANLDSSQSDLMIFDSW